VSPRKTSQTVTVVGQGYVGLPIAMAACDSGYEVLGLDVDSRKIELLTSGRSHVEDISDQVVSDHLKSGRYRASADWAEVDVLDIAVITVPTPLENGKPDLSFVVQAAEELATLVQRGSLVILESTTYPGTTEEILLPILEKGTGLRGGEDFFVGYSPERIDPGNKQWDLFNTPKVISGINEQSLGKVKDFYSSLGIPVVPVSGTREAELTKLIENTFRHVNIALVNELMMFSEHLKVDIWESIDAATTKPFGYMRFVPGPGVGGHCLPIDPSYLSWAIHKKAGRSFKFVELANSINKNMPSYVVEKLFRTLKFEDGLQGTILIVGLAYKPNTGDIRESPALDIAHLLAEKGLEVCAFDPHVPDALWPSAIARVRSLDERRVQAAVIVTPHDAINLDFLNLLDIPILDTRNCLKGPRVESI